MKEDDIQHSLIKEYMYKYLNDRDIKNLKVSNIVELSNKKKNVFVIFSLEGISKASRLNFEKNRHNYWIVKKFKMADSLLELK